MGPAGTNFALVWQALTGDDEFRVYAGVVGVFTSVSKLVLVGLMWVGRLEMLPVLVLFTGSYWRD
ncbi:MULTISPECIES: potassium transporter TrkG [Halobacterium]|uniref:potassium transporter TrkG n=1 Tax=Halobacterium TaxID=2239 RepID=UPI0019634E33|nr:potassium transporter TrkG [Halobacterium salinarum]QRY22017.1 hypothetical protein JT689_08280 [Halobacterium sp. GSL-19]MCF2164816.1 hypothetical protein [Halobacterium salinarum]MCF2168559.1 hypothetical protein [Halobacterium salinarum]MCF2239262.1 hypothetical protein [Halobacterium salinarum]WOY07695.1 potassium transporter TrkG [Halobacterium salinarum]